MENSKPAPRRVPVLALGDLPAPPPGKSGWPWTLAPVPLPPAPAEGSAWPPIGLVTPSYNQGEYIEETIRSVLLQGYPALEYFIEDAVSSDRSAEVIRKYESFFSGAVSEKDRGQAHAINKGMARLSHARWANWINSDDVLLPGALAAVGRRAARGGPALVIVGNARRRRAGSARLEEIPRSAGITGANVRRWHLNSILQPASFFSLEAFRTAGGLDESLHYAMDFDLWVRLGERGAFDLIDDALAIEVRHRGAKTTDAMGRAFGEVAEVLFRRGYAEEGREFVASLQDNFERLAGIVSPITENWFYRTFLRGWAARRFPPKTGG